jgi:hypothetical protein
MDGAASAGSSAAWSRGDHVHPTDTSRYAASNPSGYVTAAGAATAAPVQSVATRTGAVTLTHGDITDWTTALAPYAPLASPVLTGDPQAPTPVPGDNDTSVATTAFVQAATATALHDVGRNLLHNSLFNVQQRGAGPWTVAGAYTADRWKLDVNLDTINWTAISLGDTDRTQIGDQAAVKSIHNTFTGNAGGAAYNLILQPIESVYRLAGKTVTVSFWAQAASGTPKLGISVDQIFGTGTNSPSGPVYSNGQSVTLSTTWTRYSATFTLPSAASKVIGNDGNDYTQLVLWFSSGTSTATRAGSIGVQSGAVALWGVQLEVGNVATPLEKPDPQQDWAKCQRFYQVLQGMVVFGYVNSSTTLYAGTSIAQMRAVPAQVATNIVYTNANNLGITMTSNYIVVTVVGIAVGMVYASATFALSADF